MGIRYERGRRLHERKLIEQKIALCKKKRENLRIVSVTLKFENLQFF